MPTASPLLADEVLATIRVELEAAGFRRRAGGIFTRPITSEILAWVGLNQQRRFLPEHFGLIANVGLRDDPLERAYDACGGYRDRYSHVSASYVSHYGYLGQPSDYRPWDYELGQDLGAVVPGQVADFLRVAEPFWAAHTTHQAVLRRLLDGGNGAHRSVILVPILQALLGQEERMRCCVERHLETLPGPESPYGEEHRAIAAALLAGRVAPLAAVSVATEVGTPSAGALNGRTDG